MRRATARAAASQIYCPVINLTRGHDNVAPIGHFTRHRPSHHDIRRPIVVGGQALLTAKLS
jgi:hypothetical protein